MSGVLFTTLGTLSPKAYNLFLILAAIGFFGIYIPWKEKKKTGGGSPAPGRERSRTPMNRAKAFMTLVGCIPVMTVGLTMLIACAIMGAPLLMTLGAALTVFSLVRMLRAGEDFRAGRQPQAPQKPKPPPTIRAESPQPAHLTAPGPARRRRREPRARRRGAGLLTPEEYDQKRRELNKEG